MFTEGAGVESMRIFARSVWERRGWLLHPNTSTIDCPLKILRGDETSNNHAIPSAASEKSLLPSGSVSAPPHPREIEE